MRVASSKAGWRDRAAMAVEVPSEIVATPSSRPAASAAHFWSCAPTATGIPTVKPRSAATSRSSDPATVAAAWTGANRRTSTPYSNPSARSHSNSRRLSSRDPAAVVKSVAATPVSRATRKSWANR